MKHPNIGKVIALEGCLNFRDLGGYETDAGYTCFGKLYRCDDPSRLSPDDFIKLGERNITVVIDLRSAPEIAAAPNPFSARPGIAYHHIPLLDGLFSEGGKAPRIESLSRLYTSLLEEAGHNILQVFRVLAGNREGAAVFHCTAGKDRTGLIAAILLKLVGVGDEDVIFDYSLTAKNMEKRFREILHQAGEEGYTIPQELFRSDPAYMREALNFLNEKFGGAEAYLLGQGLRKNEAEALRTMMRE